MLKIPNKRNVCFQLTQRTVKQLTLMRSSLSLLDNVCQANKDELLSNPNNRSTMLQIAGHRLHLM